MAQMSLFDTVQDNDIVEEIKELDMTSSDTHGSYEYPVQSAEQDQEPLVDYRQTGRRLF